MGTNFFYKKCDVTKKTEIEEIFRWIANEVGSLAILVNCAGVLIRTTLLGKRNYFSSKVIHYLHPSLRFVVISSIFFPYLDVDDENISQTLNVNVKGVLLCCKEAMKCMIQNNVDGHIININRYLSEFSFYK